MDTPVKVDIGKQLQAARQNLLDLTMRNRLLNFKPTNAKSIKVIEGIPSEIYDVLVLQEKKMEFKPLKKYKDENKTQKVNQSTETKNSKIVEEKTPEHEEIPQLTTKTSENPNDRFLQTSLERDTLEKNLFNISHQAYSVLEEQGYTILYLAMGFLEWTEDSNSTQSRLAPLILIPVEFERTKVNMALKLIWTGEDIFTNISLQATLLEQGIVLPEFEMPDNKLNIDSYFKQVAKAISNKQKWQILNEIYLGFFSFTKFVMYKDLDPKSWSEGKSPASQPLIKAIFDPSSNNRSVSGFQENEVDEKLKARDIYHVMDADPSQIAVIEDVKAGKNLVVEGPPGTGKSQTITNIIAELLVAGKTVLFVSEKMAALEVVKSRLDKVSLGDFCLELHSRKSNKKEVLRELERTCSMSPPKPIAIENDFNKLDFLKSELNNYAEALRKPLGEMGLSPFSLFCIKEKAFRHFADNKRPMPRINFLNVEKCSKAEWISAMSVLSDMAEILPLVKPVGKNPWKGCEPTLMLPSDITEIEKLIDECKNNIIELEIAIGKLIDACEMQRPATSKDVINAISAAKVIAISKPIDRNVLKNPEWNELTETTKLLIQKVETFQKQLPIVKSKFNLDIIDKNIDFLLKECKEFMAKFFILRLINRRYYDLRREISSIYKDTLPEDSERIIVDLTELIEFKRLKKEIQDADAVGRSLFGSHWRGDESDPQILYAFSKWIVSFRQQLLNEVFNERVMDRISAGVSKEKIELAADSLDKTIKQFIEKRDHLAHILGVNYELIFGTYAETVLIKDYASRLDLWKTGLAKLQRWSQFIDIRKNSLNTVASCMIEAIDSDSLESKDIIPCFEGNFSDNLLRCAFVDRPVLSNFVGELHEKKINSFMDLDRELICRNQQRLAYILYQNQPHLSSGASPNSEAGILLGEFNRKRRHMPIRKLISQAGGLIQKIKPCFMMSPLSIAQFLDPKTACFDVIVFDEASQVRPEDALGALMRGKQAAIIGDTRQLPPTSFFDHIVESDDGDDTEITAQVADIESVLHLCKTSFPSKTLRWHYRSKHESLIAVSNQEFYDNRLVIYPSPVNNIDNLGLKLIHLPDTVYDRGKSGINRMEARTVAKAAIEHYKKNPDKSLGVGTFNTKQQQAILEEVDMQIREHPDMEEFFKSNRNDHFFVKNLETIQGDERDVIFISIGFGFDEFKRLTLNFGPLNQDGGERRLNVLISRARERCIVFSNFKSKDLLLDANTSFGLKALKVFLDFAENRNLHSIQSKSEDTDSPFEDSVYDTLRNKGYEIHKQVGCAGYRVDLAIISPKFPGRYILGIECDGAKYHSSPVARDRDRLRQQILEGLGWNIYRVWSTDWYRNRADTERRLLSAAENAKKFGNSSENVIKKQVPTVRVFQKEVKIEDNIGKKVSDNTLDKNVPEYEMCTSVGIYGQTALDEMPVDQIAKAFSNVVEVEGPVHFEEVVRRIRSLLGLKRTGNKIHDSISRAAEFAERRKAVIRRGDFYWSVGDHAVKVRRRCGDTPAKIELICDEEVAEAVKLVLKQQFATMPDDLIVRSSRVLGFKSTSEGIAGRIKKVIEMSINKGELNRLPNGMIDILQ